jgi:hypothetical protein
MLLDTKPGSFFYLMSLPAFCGRFDFGQSVISDRFVCGANRKAEHSAVGSYVVASHQNDSGPAITAHGSLDL